MGNSTMLSVYLTEKVQITSTWPTEQEPKSVVWRETTSHWETGINQSQGGL